MKSLLSIILLTLTTSIMAQQKTFIYEITLYEQYKNSVNWSEKEKEIQQEHIVYLDSLTKSGHLQLAGIIEQGLENQTGFIILTTSDYDKAMEIVQNDPSVKKGMMSVILRPVNIYFKEICKD